MAAKDRKIEIPSRSLNTGQVYASGSADTVSGSHACEGEDSDCELDDTSSWDELLVDELLNESNGEGLFGQAVHKFLRFEELRDPDLKNIACLWTETDEPGIQSKLAEYLNEWNNGAATASLDGGGVKFAEEARQDYLALLDNDLSSLSKMITGQSCLVELKHEEQVKVAILFEKKNIKGVNSAEICALQYESSLPQEYLTDMLKLFLLELYKRSIMRVQSYASSDVMASVYSGLRFSVDKNNRD